jgi:hypothetical protein
MLISVISVITEISKISANVKGGQAIFLTAWGLMAVDHIGLTNKRRDLLPSAQATE